MTFDHAFVWIWLPRATAPVVAGKIEKHDRLGLFAYGRSYLERPHAIALSPVDLPLQPGTFTPTGMNVIHPSLRDAAPDAWGRRVIEYLHRGKALDELDYLLLSGSDRIGALDFQLAADAYVSRDEASFALEDMVHAATAVEQGEPLPRALELALLHGTSVGGARPKALLTDRERHLIAKFSTSSDTFDIVKAEFAAMSLARRCGLSVAAVSLRRALRKDVLLVERFDRRSTPRGVERKHILSGLSLLNLNEQEARYASYRDLADLIRTRFDSPRATLRELFRRLVFNILVGNTDDHARNHAAFWDGEHLTLTPAYDICPQRRTGGEATQAMAIGGTEGNASTLANAVSACESFQLSMKEARSIASELLERVRTGWPEACDEAGMSKIDRERLTGTAVLNPFCLQGWPATS
jgi:serine/threonine-protein kinase HipA